MADVSKGAYHINDSPIHEVTEDQDEYSQNIEKDQSEELINTQDSGQRTRKGSKGGLGQTHVIPEPAGSPLEYIPVIYLSIVASGLPPNSNMRILIQNQRLDDNNRYEVLRSLRKRLEMIEDQLVEGYKKE